MGFSSSMDRFDVPTQETIEHHLLRWRAVRVSNSSSAMRTIAASFVRVSTNPRGPCAWACGSDP